MEIKRKRFARFYLYRIPDSFEEECFRKEVPLINDRDSIRYETAEELLSDWFFSSSVHEKLVDFSLFSIGAIDTFFSKSDTKWCVDIYEVQDGASDDDMNILADSASLFESDFLKEFLRILEWYSDYES